MIRIILFISVILLSGRINQLQYPGLLKPSFVFSSLFFDQSCPHVLQIAVTLSKQEKSNVLRENKSTQGVVISDRSQCTENKTNASKIEYCMQKYLDECHMWCRID